MLFIYACTRAPRTSNEQSLSCSRTERTSSQFFCSLTLPASTLESLIQILFLVSAAYSAQAHTHTHIDSLPRPLIIHHSHLALVESKLAGVSSTNHIQRYTVAQTTKNKHSVSVEGNGALHLGVLVFRTWRTYYSKTNSISFSRLYTIVYLFIYNHYLVILTTNFLFMGIFIFLAFRF